MYSVGLTGGIASGKSTIASRLVELGAHHVDADRLSRVAVEPGTEALRRIRDAFGAEVLARDGTLDRAALGKRVFADADALARLNSILHPAIAELSDRTVEGILTTDPDAIIVFDAALLVESGQTSRFDLVVVALASEELRISRMIELRGMSREQALQRIRAQATDRYRGEHADVVIDTGGTLEKTRSQVDSLYHRIVLSRESSIPR